MTGCELETTDLGCNLQHLGNRILIHSSDYSILLLQKQYLPMQYLPKQYLPKQYLPKQYLPNLSLFTET